MHPRIFAEQTPDKPAVVIANGGPTLSYGELEARANQAAHLFQSLGVKRGDKVAMSLENCLEVFEFAWGAQRIGALYIAISSRLTADEISYILDDSGSKLFLGSDYIGEALDKVPEKLPGLAYFTKDGAHGAYKSWSEALDAQPTTPVEHESIGLDMLYSSGTTGKPKGVLPALPPEDTPLMTEDKLALLIKTFFGADDSTVYLCPAPLYHAAPLRWSQSIHRLGGTVVVMSKFDSENALELIEKHKINVAQFVPTHFNRLLALDEDVRAKYDVSSLKAVVHAAAPCPIPVKEKLIDWWGPILFEYYAGSEGNGMTFINSEDWLTHKGSVGKAIKGIMHICDENGDPLPQGEEGLIYFEKGDQFSYYNDPEKTAEATNSRGWTTLGDVGRLDEDGFLYLTDRKSFMIISGGVNVYPQEIENHLITHPKVADAAVIGAPDEDMGEKVVAVIQLHDHDQDHDETRTELTKYCRESLSGIKTPRQIDFRKELPRAETGKLYKRLLRDEYWKDAK